MMAATLSSLPVIESAASAPLQVAAIDFGTTYSGYAFSFRTDFLQDPLKIQTNKWESVNKTSSMVSMKAPSCVLFNPDRTFHSFGFEAEDHYSRLSSEEEHANWFFFKRFKMMLYENKDLKRNILLSDDKGLQMPAMTVFATCIKYLKEHLLSHANKRSIGLRVGDVFWVLTVPAIWDDSAKQFMREAAVEAGIPSKNLTLALEPEAASLFCRHLPVEKVQGADEPAAITHFGPGKRYLVLDAGGGTVDITVHETHNDGGIRELYKANGGPWGGTRVDAAYARFLEHIAGKDVIEKFLRENKEDAIELFRDFEIKKKTIDPKMDPDVKITFRLPLAIHEIHRELTGHGIRQNKGESDEIAVTGEKVRVYPKQAFKMFEETCSKIVDHLKDIIAKPSVQGTESILMVGGFSESKFLQHVIRENFPQMRVIIPEEAGVAVLMGAVIFGHDPSAIISRVSKHTYGIKTTMNFDPSKHPESKKRIIEGKTKCEGCFSKHVEVDQEVFVGYSSEEKCYGALYKNQDRIGIKVFTSTKKNPMFVDGCTFLGSAEVDVSDCEMKKDKDILIKMIYGKTELGVVAKKVKTDEIIEAKFEFLG